MRALAFGWTGYADTPVPFSDFYAADHTISAWVLFQYPYAYEGPILAVQGSGNYVIGQAEAWGPLGAPESKLLIRVERSQQTINVALRNDRWYHLAAVRQANTLTVYLDGAAVASVAVGGRDVPDGTLRFGRAADGLLLNGHEAQFYGKVADVVIYRRALSPQDLSRVITQHRVGSGDPTVLASWRFVKDRFKAALHGEAQAVARDRSWNGLADRLSMPLPRTAETRLPFAAGDSWYIPQGWARQGSYTHFGYAAFCWDFVVADYPASDAYPAGTMGAPIYAPCSGDVIREYDEQPAAKAQPDNWVHVRAADGVVRTCQHLLPNSVRVTLGQHLTAGQAMAQVSLFPDNAHLHMAGSNNAGEAGDVGSVTVPLVMSDYEVRQPDGSWRRVARGIPEPGDVVRRM